MKTSIKKLATFLYKYVLSAQQIICYKIKNINKFIKANDEIAPIQFNYLLYQKLCYCLMKSNINTSIILSCK